MARLQSGGTESRSYVQGDVTDLDSLRAAILKIKASHGSITSIIHTAAIVRDATIQKAEVSSLDEVLAPKVTGAWNLHVVSLELCPSLKAFVLFSSIRCALCVSSNTVFLICWKCFARKSRPGWVCCRELLHGGPCSISKGTKHACNVRPAWRLGVATHGDDG